MELAIKIEKELKVLSNEKHREFSKSTGMANGESKEMLGVRLPLLRNLAKKLAKNYELSFLLQNINENYYEEVMLKGIIIGEYKNLSWDELEYAIKYFVPKITDWGICDTFCNSLKISKKYLPKIWLLLKEYLKSDNEFDMRFALVMILNYFLIDEYIDEIFEIINNVKSEKYYVKMANAWLISYCAIKYYDKTYSFLKDSSRIDKWTHNKAIQKSIESYRVTKEQKNGLRKLKKK